VEEEILWFGRVQREKYRGLGWFRGRKTRVWEGYMEGFEGEIWELLGGFRWRNTRVWEG
jgi:hypothetical protein